MLPGHDVGKGRTTLPGDLGRRGEQHREVGHQTGPGAGRVVAKVGGVVPVAAARAERDQVRAGKSSTSWTTSIGLGAATASNRVLLTVSTPGTDWPRATPAGSNKLATVSSTLQNITRVTTACTSTPPDHLPYARPDGLTVVETSPALSPSIANSARGSPRITSRGALLKVEVIPSRPGTILLGRRGGPGPREHQEAASPSIPSSAWYATLKDRVGAPSVISAKGRPAWRYRAANFAKSQPVRISAARPCGRSST